jgi:hypothetical protein
MFFCYCYLLVLGFAESAQKWRRNTRKTKLAFSCRSVGVRGFLYANTPEGLNAGCLDPVQSDLRTSIYLIIDIFAMEAY